MFLVATAYAVALTVALGRAPARADAITRLDRACGDAELVVTATALCDGRSPGGTFAPFIIADAADSLAQVRPAAVAPIAATPSALVAAVLALAGPWLLTPPRSMVVSSQLLQSRSSRVVAEGAPRPDRGEIVRRAPTTPVTRELGAGDEPDRGKKDDAVDINPRIPGTSADDDNGAGNGRTREPTAGIGAGEGAVGVDRRGLPSLPFDLAANATGVLRVEVGRAGAVSVSAAVPAAYRRIVADFTSEAK
jgi:hypothetical protein